MNNIFFRTILRPGIYGIMGKPRAGKTTLVAAIAYENYKRKSRSEKLIKPFKFIYDKIKPHYDNVYCTDLTIQNTIKFSYYTFGKWEPAPRSLILLEECGIGFNNRNYKSMPEEAKRLIAYIGHKKSSIVWSSQTADIDICLRVRTHKIFMIRKWLSHFSSVSPIDYEFGVDNERGEMRDIYHTPQGLIKVLFSFITRSSFMFWRKPYYKMFDSFEDNYKYPLKAPVKQ